MNATKKYIQDVTAAFAPNPPLPYELVSTYGIAWDNAEHIPGGEERMCFKNALHMAEDKGWMYAEGWATRPGLIPLEHAWCVRPDGSIVDNTWEDGMHYFGLVFDMHMAVNLVLQTGYYGILPNLFLLNRKVPDVKRWIVNSLSPRYSAGNFQ